MTDVEVGARLGRYRLLAPIGMGGMGSVWAALDEQADVQRLVALKLALGDTGADSKFWSALADEANVVARLDHPNVCRSSGLGSFGGVHFLVMEWSDGASLRELLDALPDHRLPAFMAARIGIKVAAGLHAAHQLVDDDGVSLGVVHRDVSPQNVLIDRRGRVRIADFGVAKARSQLRRPTETGEIKGKLSYMAPEQIVSKGVDARADIFALACVVYEAALGRRVFPGGDALSTMYQVLEEPPVRPREIDPTFPERLELALLKALAKDPAERFQSAPEFAVALEDFVDDELTEPGDRHLAKLLQKVMGERLEARRQDLETAVARIERGESISPQRQSNKAVTSAAPDGVAVTQQHELAPKKPWLAVALGAATALGALGLFWQKAPVGGATRALSAAEGSATVPTTPVAIATPSVPAPLESSARLEPSATALASSVPAKKAQPATKRGRISRDAEPNAEPTPGAELGPAEPSPPLVTRRKEPLKPPRVIDQSNPFAP